VTRLRLSLTTPAEISMEALTAMDEGGPPRNKTEMGGGGGVMFGSLPRPHPVRTATVLAAKKR
jgi:hypothetical protein